LNTEQCNMHTSYYHLRLAMASYAFVNSFQWLTFAPVVPNLMYIIS
jgi:hypothetical protein